ncbi:MAG: flavodoxin [Clostridium sp.]|nr:flavodoxin [Clostridium sp.]
MKKVISILMVIALLFAFTACSNNTKDENETTQNTTASENKNTSESTSKDNIESNNGKTLVVYFSASGNTKAVAEYIADTTNGDLFELVPKDAYTDEDLNWRDSSSRVNYEHDNESARNIELVSNTVENWDKYDTVFIGYPIWWGIASWVVDGFVKSNDFTDKTVVPFCTSSSSGLGQSGELLAEMSGTGNWLAGQRFSESVSQAEVQDWVNGLDF